MSRAVGVAKIVVLLAVAACLAAAAVAAWRLGDLFVSLRVTTESLPSVADAAVAREMKLTRAVLDKRLASLEGRVDSQIGSARSDVSREIGLVREMLDTHLGDVAASVGQVAGIRSDIKPTVDAVNELAPSIGRNTLGLIAAAKVTAGETAQAARRIDAALPEVIESGKRIAQNSDKTTEATAKAMNNVAELTKPLPRWLRIPIQLSPLAIPFIPVFK